MLCQGLVRAPPAARGFRDERDSKLAVSSIPPPHLLPTRRVRNCRDARERGLKSRLQRRPVDFGEPEDRLKIWLGRRRMSSPSTTSVEPASNGSRRARARSDGRGCHAARTGRGISEGNGRGCTRPPGRRASPTRGKQSPASLAKQGVDKGPSPSAPGRGGGASPLMVR
jgi:hypothetical protein